MDVEVVEGTGIKKPKHEGVKVNKQRVAAYCRVSTDLEEQLYSYQSQMSYYKEYISSKPEWDFVGIYADEGITGTMTSKRDGFLKMINDCMSGKIDLIITKSISRFARNTLDVLKYVRILKDKQIGIFFEEENINTLTMDGELLLTVLSSVYQQEVENTSSHVTKGLHMKMSRGEMVGFFGCLGYDYHVDTKTLTLNSKEAEIVKYIFRRYLEGAGTTMIARELTNLGYKTKTGNSKWNCGTVLWMLSNETYTGDLIMGKSYTVNPITKRRLMNHGESNKYIVRNHHTAIISRKDFDKVQEIRTARGRNLNHNQQHITGYRRLVPKKYAFTSMLECGFCGNTFSRRAAHSGSRYKKVVWQCQTSTKYGAEQCPHSRAIDEAAIEKAFMESYRLVVGKHKEISEELLKYAKEVLVENDVKTKIDRVGKELRTSKEKKDKLIDLRLEDAIDEDAYLEKFHELSRQIDDLTVEYRKLQKLIGQKDILSVRMECFRRALEDPVPTDEFNRAIFESVVEKVIIGGYDDDGSPAPYKITFIYKIGVKDDRDGNDYKSQRRSFKKKEPASDADSSSHENGASGTSACSLSSTCMNKNASNVFKLSKQHLKAEITRKKGIPCIFSQGMSFYVVSFMFQRSMLQLVEGGCCLS